jgi:hypothetical protein
LYKLMGKNAVGTEVRPSKKSILRGIPGVGRFLDTALSHSIDNFVGGRVEENMIRMAKPDYYAEHRRIIDLLNETSKKLKGEADEQGAEVRKQRKGGSSHLVCGGRRMRGFIVAGDSDSESDMEGGAEPPMVSTMPMESPMGVPFDMVRLTEPALPSYNREGLSGGRRDPKKGPLDDEMSEQRREAMRREVPAYIQIYRRILPHALRNGFTGQQTMAEVYIMAGYDEDLAEEVFDYFRMNGYDLDAIGEERLPRGMNNAAVGRQLQFEGQGQTFAKMTEASVGMSKEELKDLKKKAKGRKTREQLMAELEEAKKKLAEAPEPSKTALDRLMEGGAKMTLPMLKAKAKEMGLKGFSKMKKAELMDALKGGGPMSSGVRRINRGMKGKMAPLAAKVAENIISNRGNPVGMVADLTTTAMGGAKEKPKNDELKGLLAEYMGKLSIERPKGRSFEMTPPAMGLTGTVSPKVRSPKEAPPKVQVKPATQTLSLGLPPPKAPAKGRGRLQRRSPKTLRLSVKDKKKR